MQLVLDLGRVPLANGFIEPEAANRDEPKFPLGLQFCSVCAIVQIPETVDPEILFRHYLYTPAASSTWLEHCEELSEWIHDRIPGPARLIVEPASNDGTLLRAIQRWAPQVLGVEPARNIAEQAVRDGIPTLNDFFGEAIAQAIRLDFGPASAVVGTNVLAHVPDLIDFLRGAAGLLEPDGMLVIEAPYLRDLVESVAYDTIYHEHVSYLSVTALARAFQRAGLVLAHVERTPIHGGSIRFVGRHPGVVPDQSVAEFLMEELRLGYADGSALTNFAERVDRLREKLARLLNEQSSAGGRVAAYGATAKGNTLITTSRIEPGVIRYIVDRNPLKQGRLTPGSHIPVVGPERLEQDPVDVLLILAWNIAEEIVEQQRWFSQQGGRFLVPIPEPRFID